MCPKLYGQPADIEGAEESKKKFVKCMKVLDGYFLADSKFISSNEISIADLMAVTEFSQLEVGIVILFCSYLVFLTLFSWLFSDRCLRCVKCCSCKLIICSPHQLLGLVLENDNMMRLFLVTGVEYCEWLSWVSKSDSCWVGQIWSWVNQLNEKKKWMVIYRFIVFIPPLTH